MNQESLRYLGSVIAESVSKGNDVVKTTKFKGGISDDPEILFVFIYEMEDYAESRNMDVGGKELTRLSARYLTGEALIWYKTSKFIFEQYPWPKFVDELKNRYLDTRFESGQLRKLTHGTQKRDVKSYADEFMKTARYVRTEWTDPSLLKEFFYSGLKTEIKTALVTEAVDERCTLLDLITKAQQIDEIRFKEGKRSNAQFYDNKNQFRSNFNNSSRAGGNERTVDAEGDTIMANLMQSKKLSWSERQFLSQNDMCFNCRQPGHKSYSCPYKNNYKKNPPQLGNKSDLN